MAMPKEAYYVWLCLKKHNAIILIVFMSFHLQWLLESFHLQWLLESFHLQRLMEFENGNFDHVFICNLTSLFACFRCLHQWKPHGGKPMSCLFFLDDHKNCSSE